MPPENGGRTLESSDVMSKRTMLLGVAGLLSAAALFAVAVLLFGHFGETEGKILGTTAVLAAYGVLALPATILLEQGRGRKLALALAACAALTGALVITSIWWEDGIPNALGRLTINLTILTLAGAQTAALVARARDSDPGSVRRLFRVSLALAAVIVGLVTIMVWARIESAPFGRLLGSFVILDLLTVALQPIFARARPVTPSFRLLVTLAGGELVPLTIEAPDLAAATAKAIRSLQHEGHAIALIQVGDGALQPPGNGDGAQTVLSGSTSASGV